MSKILIDDKEFNVSDLSENSRSVLSLFQYTEKKIAELTNILALLQKAKNGYVAELKSEVLAQKAGIVVDE